ncbi:MAG: hypothetical protein IPK33_22180 [Gemmatimonadetes bacterium]|nr:hypothetical protein [Gemmatimonadota bacterium]
MPDDILARFLRRQYEDGMALAAASDLLQLQPLDGDPTDRYVAEYFCRGLVRAPERGVREHDRFRIGIWFPPDYLRRADPFQVLTWLGPRVFHPNISEQLPVICVGRLRPGTGLTDLLYQCFEIITYQKFAAHDPLNEEASRWARANLHRLPIDRRPLKWRACEVPS